MSDMGIEPFNVNYKNSFGKPLRKNKWYITNSFGEVFKISGKEAKAVLSGKLQNSCSFGG